MGKITPRLKTLLVLVTFLGFTNFILSETNLDLRKIVQKKIFVENFEEAAPVDAIEVAKTSETRKKITPITLPGVSGIKMSAAANEQPEITSGEITHATCDEKSDGGITINVTGGTSPYSYSWSNGATTKDLSNVPAGTYSVTVTDDNEETATLDNLEVEVRDDIDPVAKVKNITVQLDNNGLATISADDVDDNSEDACGIASLTIDKNSFDCSNVGPNPVTLTVTDNSGNTSTSTATVTVEDNIVPVANAKNITVQLDETGQVSITTADIDNGSHDACGIKDMTLSRDNFNCSDVGENTVTLSVTDNNGNVSTTTATVTVEDNIKPVVITKNITVTLDLNGTVSIGEDAVNNGSADSCGGLSFSTDITTFDCNDVGENTVTLTVTDKNGNSDSQTAEVTVEDNILPVVTAGNDIDVDTDPGLCSASITVPTPEVNDNCATEPPVGIRNDGEALDSPFPTGETIIAWNVQDQHGNPSPEVLQKITVTDNEDPVVPNLEDITWGCEYTVEIPVAIDNCDNEITGVANRSTTFTSSGEITWTFKDAAGNTSTAKQVITINPLIVSIQKEDLVCFGAANGTAEAVVTGGVGPFTYNWGSAGNSAKIENLTPGNYSVTVTDANGCDATAQVNITEPAELQAEYTSTDVTCSGNQDGAINISNPTGGFGNYEYSINGTNWQQSGNFSNLSGGTYSVQIRDAQSTGCVVILESALELAEPQELEMTDATFEAASCFGASDGTITVGQVNGGNGDYEYSLDNTNFTTSTTFTGVPAGTHTIFVQDSKGCSLQKTVTVTGPNVLNATVSRTNVSCFEGTDGKITITNPTGGSGNFEYSIDGDNWQNSGNFTGLTSGAYNVQIRDRDAATCTIILKENYQLTEPAEALSVEVSTTRTTTYGTATGSATANPQGGTAPYTYEWRRENSNEVLQATKNVNNFSSGNYTLTVVDSKGCRIEEDFEIIDALEAFILSRSICESSGAASDMRTSYFEVENGTAVGGVAPYTYSWDFGTDATNPDRDGIGEHQVFFLDIGNKDILLTITDSTGEKITVTQSLYVGKCYEPCGKSENIVFDPNNFYVGDINGTAIDLENNCDDGQEKFIYLKVDKSANAYNPYIELVYLVSNKIEKTSNPYFVKGCRNGDDIDEDPNNNQDNKIGEYIRFTLDPINFKCGDNVDIDNFYITWTNVSKKGCGQNNNAFCYSIDDPIIIPTSLRAEATANEILCKEDKSGIITVEVSGGFAPYTFSLTENNPNYQSNNQFINLPAGDYTIYVKDARSNKTTASVSIIEPTHAISAEVVPTPPLCFGETGEATVTATGGTPFNTEDKYEYLWNDANQQTTPTATGLVAGTYTVTVIDANGCQTLEQVTITEPEQLTVAEAGGDQSFNCGYNSTFLAANTPETGTGTWSIVSGDGGTIEDVNDPASEFTGGADTYTLRWTIAHQDGTCSTMDEVEITFVEDCSTLDFDGVDDHVVFGDNYRLSSGTFTMEAWVKLKSRNGVKTILSKRNMRNPGDGGYDLVINQGAPTFRWGNSSVSSSSQLGTQRWYHIAVIFKDSRANLYVDGIRVGNAAATNPAATSYPFMIGAEYDKNNPEIPQNYFHGWIEEVRIWNTALTDEQLRFMMNQRLEVGVSPVKGEVLPMEVPGSLPWTSLGGYYQLLVNEATNGITKDKAESKVDGELKNITTPQENTAPLPYESIAAGPWRDRNIWAEPVVWDAPNSKGINNDNINWNIARINHDITSGGNDINVLGLLSEGGTLKIANPNDNEDWQNSGQALRVSHYLKLNGIINLVGESQLIQTDIKTAAEITAPTVEFPQSITSVLEETSSGHIERAQQGTANSYNYNYWSSPVSLQGAANNSTYTIGKVMMDGSSTSNYGNPLSFGSWHEFADGAPANPRKVSNYWLHKFRGTANVYSEWVHIGSTGTLLAGEGYTMKGTAGNAAIQDRQNYVFKGKPNNGTIKLSIGTDQNYLLGNPYPSAIDINAFIIENLKDVTGGKNSKNIFNGAVYFWDHFAGKSHILKEYIGGYATRNLIGGVKAISNDERVNANDAESSKEPGRYIPVAQGFFINTTLDPEIAGNITIHGGEVEFNNSQRAFVRESTGNAGNSLFLRPEENTKATAKEDDRSKIRIDFKSPMKFNRQILVGVDPNTTDGFDLGYDAALNDNSPEDMFWMIGNREFVIQGVPDFNLDRVLPLGVLIQEEGGISIRINKLENIEDELNIYLYDADTDFYFDLRDGDFKTEMEPGLYLERYAIVFEDKTEQELPEEEEEEEESENEEDEDEEDEQTGKPGTGENPGTEEPGKLDPDNPDFGRVDIFYLTSNQELIIKNPDLIKIENVLLYSLSGQVIEEFYNLPLQKEIRLPIRSYNSAVYTVKLQTERGLTQKKIIINN